MTDFAGSIRKEYEEKERYRCYRKYTLGYIFDNICQAKNLAVNIGLGEMDIREQVSFLQGVHDYTLKKFALILL